MFHVACCVVHACAGLCRVLAARIVFLHTPAYVHVFLHASVPHLLTSCVVIRHPVVCCSKAVLGVSSAVRW